MNKGELIDKIAKDSKISKVQASNALNSALEQYTGAYKLHPRNREAIKALKKVAEPWLKISGGDAERRKEFARNLEGRSEYYKKYQPVVDAAGE